MFWNYRVLEQHHPWGDDQMEITHVIVEAYYDEEISNVVPTSYAEASFISSEGVEGSQAELERYRQALARPVLIMRDGKLEEVPCSPAP